MKSFGLDISVHGATLVEVSSDRNGYEVTRADFFPLNPNDIDNWQLDLLQGLKSFSANYNLTDYPLVVGLPQKLVSVRNLQFPFHRRLDILKSLPFELDEELPFSSEDGYFDAKTTAQNPNETCVLAFATHQKEVQELIELLSRVQIDPDIVSTEGAAFSNLIEDWQNGSFLPSAPESIPTPLVMRLYVRHDHTLVTLFHGRQMVSTRSISWGERQLILELMKNFNYPYDQAASLIPDQTKLLMMMAGASSQEIKISNVIENSLRDLCQQLRMTLIDCQDRFQAPVGFAQILGPLGRIENLNAHLTKNVGIPFNMESMVGDILTHKQIQNVSAISDHVPIAIGLAIEGLKRPKNPAINLRQGESVKRNLFWEKTWSYWGHALTLVAIGYVLATGYGYIREKIALNLDDVTYVELQKHAGTIAGLRGAQATPDRIERYIQDEQEKAKNAKIFEKVQDIEPSMKVVNLLSTTLPSNKRNSYDIRKVSVEKQRVQIEGVAQQQNTVDMIRQKLETLSANKKVQTTPPTLKDAKGVAFAFSFTLKGTL